MTGVFSDRLKQQLPAPCNGEAAAIFWNDLAPGKQPELHNYRKFLESVAGGSPYLRAIMLRDPRFLVDIMNHSPEDLLASLCAGVHAAQTLSSQAEIMVALRHAKAKASLLIALADLGQLWSTGFFSMPPVPENFAVSIGTIHRATAAMWPSPWVSMVLAN
jgi:glutamine synthetase adenylyltransferase